MPAPLKSRFNALRGRQNGSGEARRFPAVAGNSQKPSQRPPGRPKRLRRSKKGFRGSRHLSKAVSTPPGATETTPNKRGGFPRLPAPLKSRLDAPRSRRNAYGEARRVSAVAGNSQKPSRRPPEPPERLQRSEKSIKGSRDLSKAVSTPPRAAETTPKKRGDRKSVV